ncbi:hypothetical protein [Rhodococcus sp. IEGM 1408]|uniref:hypothetical protein n=1 Tax=Rhodococcus sp. IEGM 1408 TaxID=3082220 RepID=UPI0029554E03|nr:hypothetical protein [Rhodococcus sp. IEGM 1408]MDV8001908.1 hypothetical protein [Rhodococcus sp. IEGM 1408]
MDADGMDADGFDFRSSSPRARPLKVVAAALDPEHEPGIAAEGEGYPVLLKLSRVLDPEEARLILERNPFLHATAGSRKLIAMDTSVETLLEQKDRLQLLLAEVEADALALLARRRSEEHRAAEQRAAELRRRNDVLGEIDW